MKWGIRNWDSLRHQLGKTIKITFHAHPLPFKLHLLFVSDVRLRPYCSTTFNEFLLLNESMLILNIWSRVHIVTAYTADPLHHGDINTTEGTNIDTYTYAYVGAAACYAQILVGRFVKRRLEEDFRIHIYVCEFVCVGGMRVYVFACLYLSFHHDLTTDAIEITSPSLNASPFSTSS